MLKILKLIFLTCILAVGLSEVYQVCAMATGSLWLSAAIVHSALAVVILYIYYRSRRLKSLLSVKGGFIAYVPSLLVLGFIVCIALISKFIGGATTEPFQLYWIALVLWVPIIEEIVFRAGFGESLRKIGGVALGSYFSIFLFAFVHSLPSISRILEGNIYLPIPPLLLAVVCEYLFVKFKKLAPVVLLHMVCNSTVVIISCIDSRWFKWIWFLY